MKETPREMIARCEAEGFTGSTVIHWRGGKAKEIERVERWRPEKEDGVVDITEAGRKSG